MVRQIELQPWTTLTGVYDPDPSGHGTPPIDLEQELWIDARDYKQCVIKTEISYIYGCCLFILGINNGESLFVEYAQLATKCYPTAHIVNNISSNWPEGDARKLKEHVLWSVDNARIPLPNWWWKICFRIEVTLFE